MKEFQFENHLKMRASLSSNEAPDETGLKCHVRSSADLRNLYISKKKEKEGLPEKALKEFGLRKSQS